MCDAEVSKREKLCENVIETIISSLLTTIIMLFFAHCQNHSSINICTQQIYAHSRVAHKIVWSLEGTYRDTWKIFYYTQPFKKRHLRICQGKSCERIFSIQSWINSCEMKSCQNMLEMAREILKHLGELLN